VPNIYVVDNDDYESGIAVVGYRLQATGYRLQRELDSYLIVRFTLKFY
jgi:hypothetical protein